MSLEELIQVDAVTTMGFALSIRRVTPAVRANVEGLELGDQPYHLGGDFIVVAL